MFKTFHCRQKQQTWLKMGLISLNLQWTIQELQRKSSVILMGKTGYKSSLCCMSMNKGMLNNKLKNNFRCKFVKVVILWHNPRYNFLAKGEGWCLTKHLFCFNWTLNSVTWYSLYNPYLFQSLGWRERITLFKDMCTIVLDLQLFCKHME